MREPPLLPWGSRHEDNDPLPHERPTVRRSTRDILVVDDTAANLLAFEAAPAPLGCKLVLARSGAEALARLLDQDFALILLDVQMPGMDGYECARLIRSRERSRGVPIIFITAFSRDESEVLRAYQLGAVDFLFKPVHPDVLRSKVGVFVQLLDAQAREQDRLLDDQRRAFEAEALRREADAQRAAAEELAELNRQLALADKRKDEFLAILAHELRNPLAPIQTSLELVRRNPDRPVAPRILEILDRQVRQITRLVDDLLDVSRITAGKVELRRSAVKLTEVVEESLVAARPLIDSRHHKLVIRPPTDRSPIVLGDAVRLIQIVANLLNNAAKYTDPGGRIDLEWGQDGEQAFVRVTDNGRGIAPELLDRVFEMFVQERAGSDGAGGLGLGLSLVRRLVELHGGVVTAHSAGPGHGSSFEVRLPAQDAATVTAPTERTHLPHASGKGLRAVVVDDNPDLRELVAELLMALGHQVETAEDGPSGLALIRDRRPDVALVDIGLPGLDGYGLARAIRQELPDCAVRLVAMTGYGQEGDRARALDAGFDVHIIKPATAATILRAIGD